LIEAPKGVLQALLLYFTSLQVVVVKLKNAGFVESVPGRELNPFLQ